MATFDITQINNYERIYHQGKIIDKSLHRELIVKPLKKNQYLYKGKLRTWYPQYEKNPFSQEQTLLYKKAIFGLNIFTKEHLKELTSVERYNITQTQRAVQKELLLWKQTLIIKKTNVLFNLFTNSTLAKTFITAEIYTSTNIKNKFSFFDLGITKEDVAKKLFELKLLPENFYNLNGN